MSDSTCELKSPKKIRCILPAVWVPFCPWENLWRSSIRKTTSTFFMLWPQVSTASPSSTLMGKFYGRRRAKRESINLF